MIEINNLHKSFGPKTVLNGVSFEIPTGSTMCVIGRSGSGKSVLLKHIVGLLAPDEGSVKVDGLEISELSQKQLFELRSKMGYVFQGAALFDSYNVYENIVLSLYEQGIRKDSVLEGEAIRVLSAVGLLPDRNNGNTEEFEKEWTILRNKKPSDLSGGMKKRVGVARALVGNPEYIFYDEPTTGLDPVTSIQIDNLIQELTKKLKVTSLVITHDMFSVFKIAKSVVMLENGLAHFNGAPEEMQSSTDPYILDFLQRYS